MALYKCCIIIIIIIIIAFYVNSRITRNAIQVIVTHGR